MQDLVRAWSALLAPYRTAGDAEGTGRAVLARWGEPHRRYHDVKHLQGVLDAVDELVDSGTATNIDVDAIRLAAWYHDAVYAGRSDDEEQSALLAEADLTSLGVPAAVVNEVVRLVRLTVKHDPAPGDTNGAVLSDADLATLALPPERYQRNTVAIRSEYAHVPDADFRAGRARIIEALLAAPALYRTPLARQRWEQAARANLAAELAELVEPPGEG